LDIEKCYALFLEEVPFYALRFIILVVLGLIYIKPKIINIMKRSEYLRVEGLILNGDDLIERGTGHWWGEEL
jgi:hypothetical protein